MIEINVTAHDHDVLITFIHVVHYLIRQNVPKRMAFAVEAMYASGSHGYSAEFAAPRAYRIVSRVAAPNYLRLELQNRQSSRCLVHDHIKYQRPPATDHG